jgi:uncharacterized repeat protein (TIGR01451 family)
LPSLPNSLVAFECSWNQLTSLPALPTNNFLVLGCYANQLTSLPALPSVLTYLNCGNNPLITLPTLPGSLEQLYVRGLQLTSLPTMPNSVWDLDCGNNQLTTLSNLSNAITSLKCDSNQLSVLPTLSNILEELNCASNLLNSLPPIPASLQNLNCSNNQLTTLPQLPISLEDLDCSYNQIAVLPIFNSAFLSFFINNNNISCLSQLPQAFAGNISNNPLTCVPNQTNYSTGYPLCLNNDPIANPFSCNNVSITGYVYSDLNGNCSYDTTDLHTINIPVKLFDSQNNFVTLAYPVNGMYSFPALPPNTYQVRIETNNLPFEIGCGQSNTQNVTINSFNQTVSGINFQVECNLFDLPAQVSTSGWVFPGQIHTLWTSVISNAAWYNLICGPANYSGEVSIQVTGPVAYISPAPNSLLPIVNGNTFTYNIADFNTLTPQSFGLQFQTDTTSQANDQICVHIEIDPTPIDADTTNNIYDFCYQVVNSYDPNMKEVYPVNVLPGYDDWFTYTIHFQNTGNAPAFNIRLRDTLDANLDINTFEIRGYSHPAIVSINGNNLTVRFNNIMLPDSTTDYEGSMGYFQYRIKPLPNLPLGSQIENTAYIYFDYNAPIITNTTQNNFQTVVSIINKNEIVNQLKVFPNPANELLNINLQNNNIENCTITNALGQMVYSSANEINANHKIQLNISHLSAGVYFVKVSAGDGSYNAKFIKSE